MCVLLSSLNVSRKAILLTSDSKFHESLVNYFHKPRMKTNELIFRKCPKFEKMAKRIYLAGYCDESIGSFETLPKLFYGTLNDNCGNMAG